MIAEKPDHDPENEQKLKRKTRDGYIIFTSETVSLRGLTMRRTIRICERLEYKYNRPDGTRTLRWL